KRKWVTSALAQQPRYMRWAGMQHETVVFNLNSCLMVERFHFTEPCDELLFEVSRTRVVATKLQPEKLPRHGSLFSKVAHSVRQPSIDIDRKRRSNACQRPERPHIERHWSADHFFEKFLGKRDARAPQGRLIGLLWIPPKTGRLDRT